MNSIWLKAFTVAALVAAQGCATLLPPALSGKADQPLPKAQPSAHLPVKSPALVATGYAVITVQNHKVPAQQRLLAIRAAKIDAYRNLTEQVYGLRLDSSTSIAELAIANDRFRARVDGVIYGAILSSITPTNNETYEVTLTLDGAVVNDIRTLYLEQTLARAAQ